MMRIRSYLVALIASPLSATVANAQSAPPSADTSRVAVRIFAEASAREIHFAKQPELYVRLAGGLDSIHVIERRNLPSPIVAGRTYKDVYVAVEIFGRVNAECITRQLLGNRAPTDTSAARRGISSDCASLEVRGAGARPPTDSGTSPRR